MGKTTRCLKGTLIYTFVMFVLLFIVIFVLIPIVFKYSVGLQRNIIFPTWATEAANFSDTRSFLRGARNFYVTVDANVTLGAWHIVPKKELSYKSDLSTYDFDKILANQNYSIVIYLHGNGGVRSVPLELYGILRNHFQVIAVDYRGYADSSLAELNERNIVRDIVEFYKWLKPQTKARIFFWGHSLGTGVSTQAISTLKRENLTLPAGLVLETPFSTVTDVMERHFFVKVCNEPTCQPACSWPQPSKSTLGAKNRRAQRATMLDPINANGFGFNSTKYIVDVDCPIMILHAKDDVIVPYDLATKLYNTAVKYRNQSQGNVTYHLFEAKGYGHMFIYKAPDLPEYIRDFVDVCLKFEERNANGTALET